MHRRVLLAGIATLAAAPAMAQTSPAPATDAPAAPAPAVPEATPAAPAMKMAAPIGPSSASTAHMKDTMAAGSMSLIGSRIALGKAKNPMVKQFAEFETAEQDTIADILKGKMMPDLKPTGDVKAPTDAEVMGNLDAKGKDMTEKMKAMKAGAEFDRAYVKAQIAGHHELLAIQEAYLKVADDADEANVAKLAKGMIKEHLTLLGDLEKKIG